MNKVTRHPILIKADSIRKALVLNGFNQYDYGNMPHIVPSDLSVDVVCSTRDSGKTIFLLDGDYALRSNLLSSQLTTIDNTLPIKSVSVGWAFDARLKCIPQLLKIEGIIADINLTLRDLSLIWTGIAKDYVGLGAKAELIPSECGNYDIHASSPKGSYVLGTIGKATPIARALLRLEDPEVSVWAYSICVDDIAVNEYGLSDRTELYNNSMKFLGKFTDEQSAFGNDSISAITDIMRQLGYSEFIGEKVYTSDCYVRMNMIQEAWDTNNVGVTLTEPLKGYTNPLTACTELTALPTVQTSALEQAMSDSYADGIESAKIFEISHIYKPVPGSAPKEMIGLSFGAYGKDLKLSDFRRDVDSFLSKFGVSNHFFIPNDIAIAYKKGQCLLILDEKMQYLDCNCGHIADKAAENFKIEAEAFMANFEIPTLEIKAREESSFTPPELL